jgi:hypothetical protein
MLIQFGALVSDARGKISGSVFSKNYFGANAFSFQKQTVRRTTSQQIVRSSFSEQSAAWKLLTQAQRDSWTAAGLTINFTDRFGNPYNPTGFELYVSHRINMLLIGATPATTAPAMTYPLAFPAGGTNYVEGSSVYDWNGVGTYDFTTNPCVLYSTNTFSYGRQLPQATFKKFMTFNGGTVNYIDMFPDYNAMFGNQITFQWLTVKIVPINATSGLRGTPIFETCFTN